MSFVKAFDRVMSKFLMNGRTGDGALPKTTVGLIYHGGFAVERTLRLYYYNVSDGSIMIVDDKAIDALSNVIIFDSSRMTTTGSINVKSHGAGLAISDCFYGRVLIAAGTFTRGGSHKILNPRLFLKVYAPEKLLFLFNILTVA